MTLLKSKPMKLVRPLRIRFNHPLSSNIRALLLGLTPCWHFKNTRCLCTGYSPEGILLRGCTYWFYSFGGVTEVPHPKGGEREVTFNDFYSLRVDRQDMFRCLIEQDYSLQYWHGEDSDSGSSDGDTDSEETDDDDDDDDEDEEESEISTDEDSIEFAENSDESDEDEVRSVHKISVKVGALMRI